MSDNVAVGMTGKTGFLGPFEARERERASRFERMDVHPDSDSRRLAHAPAFEAALGRAMSAKTSRPFAVMTTLVTRTVTSLPTIERP